MILKYFKPCRGVDIKNANDQASCCMPRWCTQLKCVKEATMSAEKKAEVKFGFESARFTKEELAVLAEDIKKTKLKNTDTKAHHGEGHSYHR